MTRSSRSSAGCASRASAVRPESGAPCASRAVTSSTATPALSRASLPVTCQCSASCRCTRPTSCSNCRPARYELSVSTPPKVEIAARTSTPFTAKTMPKNATSHCNTWRPVKMRACFCLASGTACIGSVTSWPEKVVARRGLFTGRRIGQAEDDAGRSRRRVAVIGHQHAHFAGLVGTDIDKLAAVGARQQADEIGQRRGQPFDADDELAMLELLVDDADGVAVAQRADGRQLVDVGPDQTREVRVLVTNYGDAPPASTRIVFRLTDAAHGEQAAARDHFFGP